MHKHTSPFRTPGHSRWTNSRAKARSWLVRPTATKRGGSKSTTVVRLERHGAVTRRSPGSLSVPHPAFCCCWKAKSALRGQAEDAQVVEIVTGLTYHVFCSRGDECGRSALCAALAASRGTLPRHLCSNDVARAVPVPRPSLSPLSNSSSRDTL